VTSVTFDNAIPRHEVAAYLVSAEALRNPIAMKGTCAEFNEAFEIYFVKYFGSDAGSTLIFEQIKRGSPVGIASANFLLRLLRARKRQAVSPNEIAAPAVPNNYSQGGTLNLENDKSHFLGQESTTDSQRN
jgi:hypothetical protein